MIALLCSIRNEANQLIEETTVKNAVTLGSKPVIKGTLCNRDVLLCVGGMGKVNASHAATLLITQYHPDALLVFGVGGAYPSSGAEVGDIALAKEEIAGDEGVLTREGFKDAHYIGIPLVRTARSVIYSTYHIPEPTVKRALQSLKPHEEAGHGRVRVGTFVTLSACTGTAERARELEMRYHGLCENMEGAAVAQVAELHGVPWIEVRGISNLVEDRDTIKWDLPRAAKAVQQAVKLLVEGWK